MAIHGGNFILAFLPCILFFVISFHSVSVASTRSTLIQGQQLKDWEHLVSEEGIFRLRFFSLGTSKNRYLGISYNRPEYGFKLDYRNVVWVANRNTPISDSFGILDIDEFGKLQISYSAGSPIVLSSAQALNSDGNVRRVLWESFDYPTDTPLPGMKLGINFKTSSEDPAPGSFTFGGEPNGSSQLIVWWRGHVFWTSGLWQEGHFSLLRSYPMNRTKSLKNPTVSVYKIILCGAILEGFSLAPFFRCHYENTLGCVPEKLPNCMKSHDGFQLRIGNIFSNGFKFNQSHKLSPFDCQANCLANCSCIAYASTSEDRTGCEIWSEGISFIETDSPISREIYFLTATKGNSTLLEDFVL
ncbi:hypothetical protein P3X46_034867 [Hevea brasiliensis]|uniref:Apple domain-containing protein n=1 Tax=Hevea brasiliensis TaxID=3981 RepID=A0ABQ9K9D2_HEVBR|nr:hypothetical protein P3X46_034867 [Hevea brasiliensis]